MECIVAMAILVIIVSTFSVVYVNTAKIAARSGDLLVAAQNAANMLELINSGDNSITHDETPYELIISVEDGETVKLAGSLITATGRENEVAVCISAFSSLK